MEVVLSLIQYAFVGFFALIGGLFVLALLFGKRVEKKWDFEADFHDARGREIGEFETELVRIPKEETNFRLRTKFHLRHPALVAGQTVEVYLDDVLVMRGPIEREGRVRLGNDHVCGKIEDPRTGQVCSVRLAGAELLAEPLRPD